MAYIHGNISAGTTKATAGEVVFSNSNGVSFGVNGQTVTATVQTNYLTTAMASNRGSDFVQATAAFNGTNASGTIASNNISVSVLAQSNQSAIKGFGVSNTGQTAGNTGLSTGIDWVLAGSNSITLSQSTAAGGPNTVWVQHPAWITTADLSQNSSKYMQAWELTGNTAGTTSSLQGTKIYFDGGNSITVSGNSNTVRFSVGNYITTAMLSNAATISNINVSGGTTSSNLSAIKFIDSQGISWSLDTGSKVYGTVKTNYAGTSTGFAGANISGSMTHNTDGLNLSLSVAAPGAAAENNWFNLSGDNTAGNTTASGSTIGLSVQGALTISGTNDSVIKISAPATSSIVGTSGISVSTNGSTISIQPATVSGYNPYKDLPGVTGQAGQGTLQFDPMAPEYPIQYDRFVLPIFNTNSSNSSGSHTLSFWVGIYTRNVSSLSLLRSTSSTTALTHSGTAGSYSLYSGFRIFTIPHTTTLSGGDYWFGFLSRTTSGGANGSYSNMVGSWLGSNFLGHFGSSHNTTHQLTLGQGVYSATTSSMPDSVAFSQIRGSDSQAIRPMLFWMASSTV